MSRSGISKNALKVLYRLKDAGFQAFLVGGAVRDLLLGITPKDFDIATDADPDQVHALFRNSRLIGRRFRLAHVRFGRDIIEVATFRAAAGKSDGVSVAAQDEQGRILRDNVYGSIDEDVWRRDFTANALYYNIADFSIWDYVGGVSDVKARMLTLIGDPETRLREDPVRMLRAVRFAAKLDFEIDDLVAAGIGRFGELLRGVPPARLFDEFLKLFQSGHAERSYELLKKHGLFAELFPDTAAVIAADDSARYERFLQAALRNTDKRIAQGSSVTPMFLIGALLWGPISERARALMQNENMRGAQALAIAAQDLALRLQSRIAVPKRFSLPMRDMVAMQPRYEITRGKRALNLLEHRRFRAAYDFFVLRAETGDANPEFAGFWTDVQTIAEEERPAAFGVSGASRSSAPRKRRRRRRKKPT